MTIITLCIQFSRQKSCIITYTIFGQMHGVALSSAIWRLINGCTFSTTLGCLRFPKSILLLLAL
jgi:hypothetical protein